MQTEGLAEPCPSVPGLLLPPLGPKTGLPSVPGVPTTSLGAGPLVLTPEKSCVKESSGLFTSVGSV